MRRSFVFALFSWIISPTVAAGPLLAQDYQFFTQGGIVFGQAEPGETVRLNGSPVKTAPDGRFVIGFSRDATGSVELQYGRSDGSVRTSETYEIRSRDFDIERIDGLPPKTVTPPKDWLEQRKNERARVASARQYKTDDMDWADGFVAPATGRYSGFYGSQRILNGKPRSPHYGIDIANKTGTPVTAPAGGTVRLAAPDFLLEGGIVIIDHGFGVTSTLFHLDTVTVSEGDRIEQGAPIGTIGATGRATGPHVDWRINWGSVRLDPGLVLGLGE